MDGGRKLKIIALGTVSAVHLVGFATPSWAVAKIPGELQSDFYGLWQHCSEGGPGSRTCSSLEVANPAWLGTVQLLESLGLFALVISLMISTVLKCFKLSETMYHRALTISNAVICCTAGICISAGLIVFGINDFNASFEEEEEPHGDLGYSFFLCTGAGCFLILTFTPILVYDIYRSRQPQTSRKNNIQNKIEIYSIYNRQTKIDIAGTSEKSDNAFCKRPSQLDMTRTSKNADKNFICKRHSQLDKAGTSENADNNFICGRHSQLDKAGTSKNADNNFNCEIHSQLDKASTSENADNNFICEIHSQLDRAGTSENADNFISKEHSQLDLAETSENADNFICGRHSKIDMTDTEKHSQLDIAGTRENASNNFICKRHSKINMADTSENADNDICKRHLEIDMADTSESTMSTNL